ncbi:MAG: glycosyltransferase, partial [Planctomycetota bacterium]
AHTLEAAEDAVALVVGSGPSRKDMERVLDDRGLGDRVRFAGTLEGQELVDAYHAMDAFAFSSTSETQGMVLVEAMAAGCPVVALEARGAREVVRDGTNGRLVDSEDEESFAEALRWLIGLPRERRRELADAARTTATEFSTDRCVDRALTFYRESMASEARGPSTEDSDWTALLRALRREWDLWANRAGALAEAVGPEDTEEQ